MRDVIIACDFKDRHETLAFLRHFDGVSPYLKVGMELFYKEGAAFVSELKSAGFRLFLDLKLHDIPTTVEKAMRNLGELGVELTNVHAAGGVEMMRSARRGLDASESGKKTKLIAVTQLTSTSPEVLKNEICVSLPLAEVVRIYATNAKNAGLDGVVCSAHEAGDMHALGLLSVTPGIRLAGDATNDQKRVATPLLARELGADFIVVGRSITAAADPLEAYRRCVAEFCE